MLGMRTPEESLQKRRKVLIDVLAIALGPLLSVVVSVALRVATDFAILVLVATVFFVAITFVVRSHLRDIKDALFSRFPASVVKGERVYLEHARQVRSTQTTICALGIGADISSPQIDELLNPLRQAMLQALERGVMFYRLQIVTNAPLSWLRFIHRLYSNPLFKGHFELKIQEISSADITRITISDDDRMHFNFRYRDTKGLQDVSLFIESQDIVGAVKDHFFNVWWRSGVPVTDAELLDLVVREEARRSSILRQRMSEILISRLQTKTVNVSPPSGISKDIPDNYLIQKVTAEADLLWKTLDEKNVPDSVGKIKSWAESASVAKVT
jgi:hypothetical protein